MAKQPEGGRAVTGAPDEFADQRARSVAQGFNAAAIKSPVEPKGTAVARAADRSVEIPQALRDDFERGMLMVEHRINTAKTGGFEGALHRPVDPRAEPRRRRQHGHWSRRSCPGAAGACRGGPGAAERRPEAGGSCGPGPRICQGRRRGQDRQRQRETAPDQDDRRRA